MNKKDQYIVYSYYVLDLVHRGHLLQMMNAKAFAGIEGRSVVGILTDDAVVEKKPQPILCFDERIELARSIRYNDIVVPQETYSPLDNIRLIKPDVVFESSSHNNNDVEGLRNHYSGKIVVTPYYPSQSSTHIKKIIQER